MPQYKLPFSSTDEEYNIAIDCQDRAWTWALRESPFERILVQARQLGKTQLTRSLLKKSLTSPTN